MEIAVRLIVWLVPPIGLAMLEDADVGFAHVHSELLARARI